VARRDIVGLVNSSKKVERTFGYGHYGKNVKSEGAQTIPYPLGHKDGTAYPPATKATKATSPTASITSASVNTVL